MALEQRPLMDVEIPIGNADSQVAERVRRDVDAAGEKTVALHRREGPVVPDDLGDQIRGGTRPSFERTAVARGTLAQVTIRSPGST